MASVIDQITKLLNMTCENGCTEAEAQAAYNTAQKLINKHHISDDQLASEPQTVYDSIDPCQFNKRRCFICQSAYTWELSLATVVSEYAGCPCYADQNVMTVRRNGVAILDSRGKSKLGKSIVFYGVPEDVALAAELYDHLRDLIMSMATIRWGGAFKGSGASYCEGFTTGLYRRIQAAASSIKAIGGTTAVALYRKDDVVEYKKKIARLWLEGQGSTLAKPKTRRYDRKATNETEAARSEGYSDGTNTDIGIARKKKI